MLRKGWILLTIAAVIGLGGCGGNNNATNNANNKEQSSNSSHMSNNNSQMSDHEGMHSGSAEVPANLKQAANPAYPIGSEVMIKSDHMEGMDGAKGTITGAYDTTAYTLSYTPTTGGERVTGHKWIIHEELKDAGDTPLKPGAKAIIDADHMKGMQGAEAVIESAEQTTVYMLDYTPTTGGAKVTNHKWVTEAELTPAK